MLRFPDDEGSHPAFRLEWWYATGWLYDDSRRPYGFQITFFRNRAVDTGGNPSRFAPAQLYVAHAALADPQRGRLAHDQRIARGGFGLADAALGRTEVQLDQWSLRADGDVLRATMAGREFGFDLALRRTQPPLLHGEQGFSRKSPAVGAASYYYTLPQIAVSGGVTAGGNSIRVTGTAWLDHEWSSAPMEDSAAGWDWVGINLDDGGALMAFRMRDRGGGKLWSAATWRRADGSATAFVPGQVTWEPLRDWRSPRTAASYPVAWRVRVGGIVLELEPLMDDQESDTRASTGAVYWEGAVTARSDGRIVGRGYLELTGYWRPLRL
ncbi:MAG: lipocalin-like domain-containing protein [Betaproteobacteria bacterium]